MPTLPEIRIPMPEDEQPLTLYGRITNTNEPPKYDDIQNSNLPKEEKIRQIQYRTKAYQDDLDRQLHKDYARIGLGGLVSAVGALPIAITKNPVIGSAIGGGVYELGQGIMEGDEYPELMERSGLGAAIGGLAGGVLSKAPEAARFVNNLSGGRIGNALKPVGDKIANSKLYDYLMTDIRAFNPNKQTAYHGSPYDFEKFSNEAIGSGEGAQAHGYGHYAALNKDVANGYRWQLNADTSNGYYPILYKGERVPTNTKEGQLISQIVDNYKKYGLKDYAQGKEEIIEPFKNLINKPIKGLEHLTETAKRDLPIVENINPNDIKEWEGQLYKLSIPKDDVMLREDDLLSTQPNIAKIWDEVRLDRVNKATTSLPKFKMALAANDIDIQKAFNTRYFEDALEKARNNPEKYKDLFLNQEMTGKHLYGYLENILGSRKAANEYLQQRGIKGISYNGGIDGEARVIFNPDDIIIARKYYNQPNLYQQLTGKQNTGALVDALFNR